MELYLHLSYVFVAWCLIKHRNFITQKCVHYQTPPTPQKIWGEKCALRLCLHLFFFILIVQMLISQTNIVRISVRENVRSEICEDLYVTLPHTQKCRKYKLN
jgi:hypothetical protein